MATNLLACVECIEHDGLNIAWSDSSSAQKHFITWSSLGLARSPHPRSSNVELQWNLHCVDCDHKKKWGNVEKNVRLCVRKGGTIEPRSLQLCSGLLRLQLSVEKGAFLKCSYGPRTLGLIHLPSPLSICLAHRKGNDRSLANLCGDSVSQQVYKLSKRLKREKPSCARAADAYAKDWGSMVEMEAAAASIDCDESRLLFNVTVRWEGLQKQQRASQALRGHFDIPFHFAKKHSLKFRGLIANGGEISSGWLCIRAGHADSCVEWSKHAHVIGASIPGYGGDSPFLVVDDSLEPDMHRKNGVGGMISVTFEVLPDGNDQHDIVSLPPTYSHVVIEYLPKAISYQVMHIALADINQMPESGSSPQPRLLARDVALGHVQNAKTVELVDLSQWRLNHSQQQAVCKALCQPLHLVHGPAGTGKTRTAAALMGNLAERHGTHRYAVLFCAPTNRAVDAALSCMSKLCDGVRMLRVYSADAERCDFPLPRLGDSKRSSQSSLVQADLKRFALHWRCHASSNDDEPSPEANETRSIYKRLCTIGVADPDFDKLRDDYVKSYSRARAAEICGADIIFTTCVSVRRNAILEALWKDGAPQFRQVIIDEAAQCLEPEALCPMAVAKSAIHITMFGDHCQLRPTIQSKAAADAGMAVSLFERLVCGEKANSSTGDGIITLLDEQYRMRPDISRFPREQFYAGRVKDAYCTTRFGESVLAKVGREPTSPIRVGLILWDLPSCGKNEMRQQVRTKSGGVGSRSNDFEASHAARLAVEIALVTSGSRVAVLSWYNKQVDLITELLARAGHKEIHVGTISTAQGSEWDYVILSAVRTQPSGKGLGILSDVHVLNVALTRSILGLLVMCDRGAVESCEHWKTFASHCDRRKLSTTMSPIILPTSNGYRSCEPRAQSSQVHLQCRKHAMQKSIDDIPMASTRKVSNADFDNLLQRNQKLASYGRANHGASQMSRAQKPTQLVTITAHKGVLFGTQRKAKSWRSQVRDNSVESSSDSASRQKRRSRSRRRHK